MKEKQGVSTEFSVVAIVVLLVAVLALNYGYKQKVVEAADLNTSLIKKQLELDIAKRNMIALQGDMTAVNKKLADMIASTSVTAPAAMPDIAVPDDPASAVSATDTKS